MARFFLRLYLPPLILSFCLLKRTAKDAGIPLIKVHVSGYIYSISTAKMLSMRPFQAPTAQ